MKIKDNPIIKEEITNSIYSEFQINNAINYLQGIIDDINNLQIEENGIKRNLNQLEKLIYIYRIVTNKNYYNEYKYSQDIIGAINYDCFVCMSFSKMIKILCDACNIYSFIKYSITSNNLPHANNEVLVLDKNNNYHLLHIDATIDCLNYEDLYINKNISRINGLLLTEEDINKYKITIQYESITNPFYTNLISKIRPYKIFKIKPVEMLTIYFYGESKEEYINCKVSEYEDFIEDIAKIVDVNYEKIDKRAIYKVYKRVFYKYKEISKPINNEELLTAIQNIELAINPELGKLNTLKKLQASLEFQLKNFNNENGKSLMFTFIKK